MITRSHRFACAGLILLLSLNGSSAWASWTDPTAGAPVVEEISNQTMGSDGAKWIVLEDKLGRLFVGGNQLHVFDGHSWRTFEVPNTYALRALAFGEDGRLWAGATNEVGYFREESLGVFRYHSLLEYLPKEERLIGDVWSCANVGHHVFFFCRNRILRWDGSGFKTWAYPGASRLFPLVLQGEPWFDHVETGLYRVEESGPKLMVPANQLPAVGIMGLTRDSTGLLVACDTGVFRPGTPPLRVSDAGLNRLLAPTKIASFAVLPDGNLALGTLNAGLAMASPTGTLIRLLDPSEGLPSRSIFFVSPDAAAFAWGTTPDGIFQVETKGNISLFGPPNGLEGPSVTALEFRAGNGYAITGAGVFRLVTNATRGGRFEHMSALTSAYSCLAPSRSGLLLGRQGGVDYFDGTRVRPLVELKANSVFLIRATRSDPDRFYLSELNRLSLLVAQHDGTFARHTVTDLPDIASTLEESPKGKLWIGTAGQGAFHYDPVDNRLTAVNDPATAQPFPGLAYVLSNGEQILIFNRGRVWQTGLEEPKLSPVAGLPKVDLIDARRVPGTNHVLVAFNRPGATETAAQGLGLLSVDPAGPGAWRELAVPELSHIGSVRTLEFSQTDGRTVLWVGGTAGLLHLDYASLAAVENPAPPSIRLDTAHSSRPRPGDGLAFSFADHRLSFRIFIGDHGRSKDWLIQTRLDSGRGDWSSPSALRSFDFSNLSEGDYRFEARTVNAAGLASEPAVFAFQIMPPWYRSGLAFAGYAMLLGGGVFCLIRIRERRIRRRNRELEQIVAVRTAALVKASAAKDEFLAGVSHEIRNPMNGVIGIAETLNIAPLEPEDRRKFGLLRQCATHLASLLEDILDFSRVEAGHVQLEAQAFDLAELVDSVAAMTAAESVRQKIPVETAISPAVPPRLIGDARRIRQILLNFVTNALKYAGGGQVSVTVWCRASDRDRTEVIFAVSDEGPGIAPEEQKRLFTRFERGAASQAGRVPGTGLGLALCKGLAEKMGGAIWLESELGQGSCFYFSAPLALPPEAAPTAPGQVPAGIGQGRSALVVDDEEYNRIVLTDLLTSLGYSVTGSPDGRAAVDQAAHQAFDVVFLDYNLPGMTGLEASRAIRLLPNASAQALIVATTAFSTPEKRAQCTEAGMDIFLGKPVTGERLRAALAAVSAAAPDRAEAAGPPADPLDNLRMIVRRKGSSLAAELVLFLSEFAVELEHLTAAVAAQDAAGTGHYAHLLYGRCSFVGEAALEHNLRLIEAAGATGRWEEGGRLLRQVEEQLADLRVRYASVSPDVPRG